MKIATIHIAAFLLVLVSISCINALQVGNSKLDGTQLAEYKKMVAEARREVTKKNSGIAYDKLSADLKKILKPSGRHYVTEFSGATPLFYRINPSTKGWEWAPPKCGVLCTLSLGFAGTGDPSDTWTPVAYLWATDGPWAGQTPVEANVRILVQLSMLEDEENSEWEHNVVPHKDKTHTGGGGNHEEHSPLHKVIHIIHEVHLGLEIVAERKEIIEHLERGLHYMMHQWKMQEGFRKAKEAVVRGAVKSMEAGEAFKQFYMERLKMKEVAKPLKQVWDVLTQHLPKLNSADKAAKVTQLLDVAKSFNGVVDKIAKTSFVAKGISTLKTVGKFVTSHKFLGGLLILGTVLEGVDGFVNSDSKTIGGKLATGALTTLGAYVIMANPLLAVVDLLLPKEYKISTMFKGAANLLAAWGESLITGNSDSLDVVKKKVTSGEYGVYLQKGWELWKKMNIVARLRTLRNDVFKCFNGGCNPPAGQRIENNIGGPAVRTAFIEVSVTDVSARVSSIVTGAYFAM